MEKLISKIKSVFKGRTWLALMIVCAAMLLEIISAAQYYYTKNILENELENKAAQEITMKAILVKSMLNTTEQVLNSHKGYLENSIEDPETIDKTLKTAITANNYFNGVGLAFKPGYYNNDDELFEPWVFDLQENAEVRQIAQRGGHDYTNLDFYKLPMTTGKPYWSDPYIDSVETKSLITTYSIPIRDKHGELACVAGIDMSLEWLSDTLNNRHIYPSSYCLLLTDDGRLISQPSPSHPKNKDFDDAVRLINDPTANRRVVTNSKINVIEFIAEDGQDACVFFHHMKGIPHWQVAVVCYDNEVFGELMRLRFKIFLFMLTGFALLGYIVFRFLKNNKQLVLNENERMRIDSELKVAKRIQNEMLPHDNVTHENFEIAASLLPAREVGGDIYDYFMRDDKLFFCIGDASGKGVASALIMSVTHSMFRSFGSRESHPARIMQKINQAVCHGNESSMFVTFFIGILDLPTGRLHYCNAGHDTPLIIGNKIVPLDVESNVALGVVDDWFYEGQLVTLNPNESLLLYTDGLTEAMNLQHNQFGLENVKATLGQHTGESPQQLLNSLHNACNIFVDGAEQSDDLTMLAVKFTPKHEVIKFQHELTISNTLSNVPLVNDFVKKISSELNFSDTDAQNLKLAIEEAVVNVINYAYPAGEQGDIAIEATSTATVLKFKIIDNGVAFAPTDAPDVDTSLTAEERQIGGLGIFLVRQLMDTINYERIDHKNVLTLTKKINFQQ